jgi:hypothetical protein
MGRSMSGETQGPIFNEVKAALEGLQKLNVPFSGPFVTPKGNRIFLVYDYVVAEEEIVALQAAGKVTPENAANLLRDFEQLDRDKLDPKFGAAQRRARHWNHP